MSIRIMILLVLGTCATANADVRMPTIFGDNMILQQKQTTQSGVGLMRMKR